jgi:hypothetical protein
MRRGVLGMGILVWVGLDESYRETVGAEAIVVVG